jgi:pyruvate-formate lyase-activating enzyme
VPTYHKVLVVTDAAINIAPALEDKADICQNAIDLCRTLGLERPKVAILAAVETVNSKMPATLDAAALCKMRERGQIIGGLLDLKAWTPAKHQALVASDIAPVLDFARRLAALRRPVWIRFVLVPGHTDGPEEFGGVADFAAGLGNVERVDVLPFHQMGGYKWKQLGMEYSLANLAPPPADAVERVCERFRAVGLKAY